MSNWGKICRAGLFLSFVVISFGLFEETNCDLMSKTGKKHSKLAHNFGPAETAPVYNRRAEFPTNLS